MYCVFEHSGFYRKYKDFVKYFFKTKSFCSCFVSSVNRIEPIICYSLRLNNIHRIGADFINNSTFIYMKFI